MAFLALLSECLQKKSERKRIPDIFPGIRSEIQYLGIPKAWHPGWGRNRNTGLY